MAGSAAWHLGTLTARRSIDGTSSSSSHATRDAAKPSSSKGQKVVVLGWPEAALPELLQQLQEAAPPGSDITIVLPAQGEPPVQPQADTGPQTQRVRYLWAGEPSSARTLLDAGVAEADSVILGSALSAEAASSGTEADALVTAAVLAIQQALQTVSGVSHQAVQQAPAGSGETWPLHSKPLHVVAVVSSYSVRRALQTFLSSVLLHCSFSYEIMVLDEFAAGMLVSVSAGYSSTASRALSCRQQRPHCWASFMPLQTQNC
jgi:hypothetical protein